MPMRLSVKMSADNVFATCRYSARRALLGALFCLAALLPLQSACAQPTGDRERGRALGQDWCSSCHLVSPDDGAVVNEAVPSFQAIAERRSTTSGDLRLFLQTPHIRMPTDSLSVVQIDDLVAYILSLKR